MIMSEERLQKLEKAIAKQQKLSVATLASVLIAFIAILTFLRPYLGLPDRVALFEARLTLLEAGGSKEFVKHKAEDDARFSAWLSTTKDQYNQIITRLDKMEERWMAHLGNLTPKTP